MVYRREYLVPYLSKGAHMRSHEYAIAREAALRLNPNPGATRRVDCPLCGGKGTFSVSNIRGSLVWRCFRASCDAPAGVHEGSLSREALRSILSAGKHDDDTFTMPEHFTRATSNPEAIRYLERNHCINAYAEGRADIRYDPKQGRVVFMVQDNNTYVDAVGRALQRGASPKWFRYGKGLVPFICPTHSNTGVLVEDAASACAVTEAGYTGVALLGTNLYIEHLPYLRQFEQVIIALDKDASVKALSMHRAVSYVVKARVALLEDDLKYMNKEEIAHVLG